MSKRFHLDFSTAYGQLILLVFLPISALALTGGFLVLSDTSRAARTIQQSTADNLLVTLQPVAASMQANLIKINQALSTTSTQPNSNNRSNKDSANKAELSPKELATLQDNVKFALQNAINDKHLQGVAIVNEQSKVLVSFGDLSQQPNPRLLPFLGRHLEAQSNTQQTYLLTQLNAQSNSLFNSKGSSLFGRKLVLSPPANATAPLPTLWLIVNIDNEPLQVARYQVMLALAITGLFTILLLLLTTHIYARRWIAPIYEMRLHLQRTNANNLYKPMTINASGEINQLQQDLVKTLRRLHKSFQELKNHAEQTEDDLRLAFDEMEMQNISIRNARDAAVSASQTKSAFLANISHELRTPLNSIDGFINLLSRHGGLNAEQDLYVQTIRKSSAHLLALVNDVLDFSKIEAGKLVLDSHEFDLYASIYDVVDMLSPLAAEKDLRLAVFFYDDVPHYLVGDALRTKQVLTNLVNNAIKFTDDGEVIVRVSLDDDIDDLIHISVQDTGRGISPEHQKVLFQSFSQGDPSITRQYGGTGLGLVISKQLTYLMGGNIGFYDNATEQAGDASQSHKIKGTTFWFTLPMSISNQEQQRLLIHDPIWQLPAIIPPKSDAGYVAADTTTAVNILVWIDHPASLQVLKGSLRELPIAITTASTLASLLESLKETGNHWDWVIVDNGTTEDTTSLLKQVRLHYAGKLLLFGYQVNLEPELLSRYQAQALYQPLDRRQLYQLLDSNSACSQEPTLPQWHGFTVLAVDDHLPNLLVLEALLAELSINVVTVNSGFDAIEYITTHQSQSDTAVDLIFMDIQMPRMSGSEAAIQIRKVETQAGHQHIPIIALTAHSLSDERDKLLASGIDDYVGKPISQAQLLQILQRWLGKHSTSVSADVVSGKSAINSPISARSIASIASGANHPRTAPATPKESGVFAHTPLAASATTTDDNANIPSLPSVSSQHSAESLANLAVIDWDDAVMRVAGKPDLAANLITLLIESIEQEKSDLQQAWQRHDRQALSHVAHRILGASRYTGVPQLRQASQNLEDKCLLNINNSSPAQFAILAPYYEQMLQALDNLAQADLSQFPALKYAQLKENDMTWKII
ncbi:ATP-binding protein [Moraxella osloensis]|uniref:histidine kinase n=1 Tax=Faucicola osloensis TaxID=34062 RepID=A0A2I5HS54_FAUOS|nr:ATP-binding protein [Moraxella osloensis]ATW71340.1 hybrid sensor histidine kinase/response regulator [Moraxella osloensis]